jgi:hypothetical protein
VKTKIFLIVFISMLAAGVCCANPIVVGVPYGGKYALATNLGLMINLASDFVALFLGFLIIKNVKAIATWKFLPYCLIVFFGGIILDVIAILPIKLFFYLIPIENLGIFLIFLVAGILLYVFNSWLAEKFFDLENVEKAVIGIVMAVLTNPVIGWLFASQN